jgi:hypothetical protein
MDVGMSLLLLSLLLGRRSNGTEMSFARPAQATI